MYILQHLSHGDKKMEGLTPSQISDSFETMVFQGGEIEQYQSQEMRKFSIKEVMGEFDKKELLRRVAQFELSDDVKYFVKEYERVFGERNIFLWKFLGVVFTETGVTLSSIDKRYFQSITDNKLLFTIVCAILDDIAEVHKDNKLLNAMSQLIIEDVNKEEYQNNEKILYMKELWAYLKNEIMKYPRYEEFIDIFMYDIKQMLNALEYSFITNKHLQMINLQDMQNYDCHNMMVFIYNGLDLMVSPDFDDNELPYLRNAFWFAQQMARIGNWLSTWKREVKEKDYSSGVFGYVFENKIIDVNDIENLPDDKFIKRIENSDVNKFFMNLWKENYVKLSSVGKMIKSVDMDSYIIGLQNVIKFHLASEGLK
jgi:hypothetical protein